MSSTRSKFLCGVSCAILISSAVPALASDADLLRVLEQKGYLTSQEVSEISAARSQREAAQGKAGAIPVVTPAAKGTLELKLSGRVQFQYDGISASIDNGTTRTSLEGTNRFSLRRVFVGVAAKLKNNWYGNAVFNFANSGTAKGGLIDTAYIGWKMDKAADVRFGYEKVPFGYDSTTSSATLLAVETSAMTNFFTKTLAFNYYHTGINLRGDLGHGLFYNVAVTNSGQGVSPSGNGMAVFGRVQYTTELDDGVKLLVGSDLGYMSDNAASQAWLRGASVFGYGFHARADIGDLTLMGEFLGSSVEGVAGNPHSTPYGAMAMVAYRVADIQPVFQYSYVNSTDFAGGVNPSDLLNAAPSAGSAVGSASGPRRVHSFYLGGNYYPLGNNDVRVSVGAVYLTAPENTGGNNTSYEAVGARAQLQLIF